MKIDAVGTSYSDTDEPESLYNHVPYRRIRSSDGKIDIVVALCGYTIHESRALWHDGLSTVIRSDCLKIVAIGKAARINKKKLPEVIPVDP